jgi:LmbE family N-acetylglucosaminyl deacetylase
MWRPSAAPACALAAAALLLTSPALDSQIRSVYSSGAAGLTQLLERLQTTASALHVGAHPDDEDSQFIARMAWGDNARVAYLSLTRGEGGQNIIGTELFEALGVIRTEELLQARRLDGGEQFFTRAIDYGFSKSRDEAARQWGEREVLADMVRVIRRFRPMVIYSRFSGTSSDGHGQHQLAGYLTPLAFEAAGDPAAFPEQLQEGLRPWRAKKLYRGAGFRPDPAISTTVMVDTGVFDPVLGRYYTEIANEGRSQHKSQEMGVIETKGPRQSALIRLDETVASEPGVFHGLDTSIGGIPALAGMKNDSQLNAGFAALQTLVGGLLQEFQPQHPARSIEAIQNALRHTRELRARVATANGSEPARAEADFLLAIKEADLREALVRAAAVVIDPIADAETLTAGGSVNVDVRTFVAGETPVKVLAVALRTPDGWRIEPAEEEEASGASPFARFFREFPTLAARYRVTAAAGAPPTQPYYLDDPSDGARYRWDDTDPKGVPFAPPLIHAEVTLDIAGTRVVASEAVTYRFADRVRGELRRHVSVTPRISVGLDSGLLIVPTESSAAQHRVVVRVTNHSPAAANGALRLAVPAGWTVSPASAPFALPARGDRTSAPFVVTAPPGRKTGTLAIRAEAALDGAVYGSDLQEIAYPHIQTHRLYSKAEAVAQVLDLETAAVNVGYVMGSGDQVPDAIRRMGVNVTLIDDETLATGDLDRFDPIVVGIRASEARPAFVANHGRLLAFVERGGTLIVQYQQNDYVARKLPPYPAEMSSRVTDETAPVAILAPQHPVFTFPNRIGPRDFEGWVQERNLYAFTTFDARYTPLLETADPGEGPQRGGHVYAPVGKGHYIYTAYAWFRQLRAGVPGAYRLFANLISLPKAAANRREG